MTKTIFDSEVSMTSIDRMLRAMNAVLIRFVPGNTRTKRPHVVYHIARVS